jgi:hypothetical protein
MKMPAVDITKELKLGVGFDDKTPYVVVDDQVFDRALRSGILDVAMRRDLAVRVGTEPALGGGQADRVEVFIGTPRSKAAVARIIKGEFPTKKAGRFDIQLRQQLSPDQAQVVMGSRGRLIVNAL